MSLATPATFHCPYCMEPNEVEIDEINDSGHMQVVDCQVCCQPIEMTVHGQGDTLSVEVQREND
ncbi:MULTISPECIES: CPXCG motif-containing cysteine-rich protein [Salinimonas]|uniref:CPXCG motif-containing cysteine-rich protein n=2 Tax=Salinimonas TaxID=288793 RepID=A0A5B7YHZ6_9ALTE|nr:MULTISPECIES: CPXCG motif-containing cysteine-rich protein [Salinimonas]MBD3585645.1 CPXCG motif-containing cysteine-rich protein [Salinimonas profundi]QCZ94960.1 CPXCG motif-containing cysteine-rich protein [Salinimonas iocasae]